MHIHVYEQFAVALNGVTSSRSMRFIDWLAPDSLCKASYIQPHNSKQQCPIMEDRVSLLHILTGTACMLSLRLSLRLLTISVYIHYSWCWSLWWWRGTPVARVRACTCCNRIIPAVHIILISNVTRGMLKVEDVGIS